MMGGLEMDVNEYLDVFIEESIEHIESLSNQLLILEKNPSHPEVIQNIFRAAHTLKGMSQTMGFRDLADLTHWLENILDDIRNDEVEVTVHVMDVLFHAIEELNFMIQDIEAGGDGRRDIKQLLKKLQAIQGKEKLDENGDERTDVKEQTVQLNEFEQSILQQSTEQGFSNYEIEVILHENCVLKGVRAYMVFEALEQLGEIIRAEPDAQELEEGNFDLSFKLIFVSKHQSEKIEEKIHQISEIENVLIHPLRLQKKDEEVKEPVQDSVVMDLHQRPMRKTMRINIDRIDHLMNLIEELVINRGRLEQIARESNNIDVIESVDQISRISSNLQDVILTMRMVPIRTVFNRFPSMVRQVSRDLGKNIRLEIMGEETELDRTVIDEIGDPLVHLIRNAIDHGIERPEERNQKGKNPEGLLELRAYHSGNDIYIEIADDGAGIDKDQVIQKAIQNELISESQVEQLTEQQIFDLMFHSGFSTSEEISDISGRGVGLDVVKNTVESLGGSIAIHSEINKGTTFSIQLPLTLSIMSALLVQLHDERYAIPLSTVVETIRVTKDEMIDVHNHQKVIDFRGKLIPLIHLRKIFSIPEMDQKNDHVYVVIVQRGDQMIGLVVDSLINQEEVVIKPLGNYLKYVKLFSGATILGDGEVALIIDSNSFIKS